MNRKEFLTQSFAAGLGLALVPGFLSNCSTAAPVFELPVVSSGELQRVRGNVFRYTHRGGTIGILETGDGFTVIDAQFPDTIKPLLDALSVKGKPVEFLCNTHHHGDHTSGNIAFRGLTDKVIAHRAVPGLQQKAAEKNKTLDAQLYAHILFDEKYSFSSGKEKITGYHFGNGHTLGDAMYHFENANVVHMGDLMFMNMIPVYRTADGADSVQWISVLQQAQRFFDDDTVFIFGHAGTLAHTVGTKSNLKEMADFLAATNDFLDKAIKGGVSNAELLKSHDFVPGFEHRKTPERFPGYLDEVRKTLQNS
ncbi:MBL fold metallo-hydrolase [Chryseobacterium sp. MFBS3-17]|uniref:MBL fold metallo-hydrolase n=1 Tax=Chryseobacterium sp. MFBS3-17 TaxID=2886689 RepID=UPI001D0DD08A|nr:MBL fold metallo-hydrolase [Chryseobacterium sp. MFBS3-17]MCC2591772.1 MBL fold metallo-hydrolase [Chryseobacterium sp. MFBS3-17]